MRRWADKWLVAAGLAGLLAAGWGLERVAAFQTAKAALRDPTVPTALLNRGSLGRLLRHLRLVRPVPNDGSLHPKSAYAKTALDASLFQKKRVVGGSTNPIRIGWRTGPGERRHTPPSIRLGCILGYRCSPWTWPPRT